MVAKQNASTAATSSAPAEAFHPYIPAGETPHEFTWAAVIVGAVLGIVFGASSLYLVLKVGLTVSASIPVAVLSITLFRLLSKVFGMRRTTILENNIVQTTGSAGESIAFGIGVTIPALMLLGFDMEVTRVMTVGVLGGLLGILMMIPLRRAFIVRQHGTLPYPEGTACADVLIVGERGGSSAVTVFLGFCLAFFHKFISKVVLLWKDEVTWQLPQPKKGILGGEFSPELLGVGYIIGPRVASIILAGGVLSYLVFIPLVAMFGDGLTAPLPPETTKLIRDMEVKEIRSSYVLYIAAGGVATGGIISMFQALPMILGSIWSGLADLRGSGRGQAAEKVRTERDLPMIVVLMGSLALVLALAAMPNLGLGMTVQGLVGAGLIVFFGFLFVTVSSRITGEIGSSSNPISGMTVATLLLTCLVFYLMGRVDKSATLTALTVAAVVCIAASNGGTTAQDLKTGFLVGATPRWQQLAILVGALTSALVIGVTLLLLNDAGTVYTNLPENLPHASDGAPLLADVTGLTQKDKVKSGPHTDDGAEYLVLHVREGDMPGVTPGRYLVDEQGQFRYLVDPGINGRITHQDPVGDEPPQKVVNKFEAPKTRLMALIIDGILNGRLPWDLVIIGALVALVLELAGVPSLPFAVGVYLPIHTSVPIFLGGALRWCVDKLKRAGAADGDASPGVLLSSGYIAGGAIAGVVVAFFAFLSDERQTRLKESLNLEARWTKEAFDSWHFNEYPTVAAFFALMLVLFVIGLRRPKPNV